MNWLKYLNFFLTCFSIELLEKIIFVVYFFACINGNIDCILISIYVFVLFLELQFTWFGFPFFMYY